jgi:hypothetical protein
MRLFWAAHLPRRSAKFTRPRESSVIFGINKGVAAHADGHGLVMEVIVLALPYRTEVVRALVLAIP